MIRGIVEEAERVTDEMSAQIDELIGFRWGSPEYERALGELRALRKELERIHRVVRAMR